ncbi:hypothetical protein D9M71_676020 [compost metagenome]
MLRSMTRPSGMLPGMEKSVISTSHEALSSCSISIFGSDASATTEMCLEDFSICRTPNMTTG